MVSPGRPLNPADQSVDKSAGRCDAASESSAAARNPLVEAGESLSLLKTSREKADSFLGDLSGFLADRQPEGKINGLFLYESMSRRHGNPTCLLPSQDSAANYENCLKCRAERCRPPPRVTPSGMYGNMGGRWGLAESRGRPEQKPRRRPPSQEGPSGEEGKGLPTAAALPLVSLFTLCFETSLCSSPCFHQ